MTTDVRSGISRPGSSPKTVAETSVELPVARQEHARLAHPALGSHATVTANAGHPLTQDRAQPVTAKGVRQNPTTRMTQQLAADRIKHLFAVLRSAPGTSAAGRSPQQLLASIVQGAGAIASPPQGADTAAMTLVRAGLQNMDSRDLAELQIALARFAGEPISDEDRLQVDALRNAAAVEGNHRIASQKVAQVRPKLRKIMEAAARTRDIGAMQVEYFKLIQATRESMLAPRKDGLTLQDTGNASAQRDAVLDALAELLGTGNGVSEELLTEFFASMPLGNVLSVIYRGPGRGHASEGARTRLANVARQSIAARGTELTDAARRAISSTTSLADLAEVQDGVDAGMFVDAVIEASEHVHALDVFNQALAAGGHAPDLAEFGGLQKALAAFQARLTLEFDPDAFPFDNINEEYLQKLDDAFQKLGVPQCSEHVVNARIQLARNGAADEASWMRLSSEARQLRLSILEALGIAAPPAVLRRMADELAEARTEQLIGQLSEGDVAAAVSTLRAMVADGQVEFVMRAMESAAPPAATPAAAPAGLAGRGSRNQVQARPASSQNYVVYRNPMRAGLDDDDNLAELGTSPETWRKVESTLAGEASAVTYFMDGSAKGLKETHATLGGEMEAVALAMHGLHAHLRSKLGLKPPKLRDDADPTLARLIMSKEFGVTLGKELNVLVQKGPGSDLLQLEMQKRVSQLASPPGGSPDSALARLADEHVWQSLFESVMDSPFTPLELASAVPGKLHEGSVQTVIGVTQGEGGRQVFAIDYRINNARKFKAVGHEESVPVLLSRARFSVEVSLLPGGDIELTQPLSVDFSIGFGHGQELPLSWVIRKIAA